MKKYLIGLDLDETLLTTEKTITSKTKKYLQELQQEGHKIVIVTGRPYRGTINFYNDLNLNTPFVVDNGAAIYQGNEKEFKSTRKTIDKKIADKLYSFIEKDLITAFYSYENKLYTTNYIDEIKFFYHLNDDTIIHEINLDKKDLPETSNLNISINSSFKDEFENYIKNNTNNQIDFRRWYVSDKEAVYEVFPKGVNKGNALKIIRDFYNIPKELTISFGDGKNDIELLKEAHFGIKMINGSDYLDEIKTSSTKYTNDEDGVIKYLKDFLK